MTYMSFYYIIGKTTAWVLSKTSLEKPVAPQQGGYCRSVGQTVGLNYLSNYWMHCVKFVHSWAPKDELYDSLAPL